jgi:uncharacterized protein (TIGR02246 family)
MTLRLSCRATTLACGLLAGPAFSQTTAEVEAANRLFQAQDWAGAWAAYDALAKSRPDDGLVRFRLGVALDSLGRSEEAVVALVAAERLGGPSPATSWRLARVCARLGRREEAFQALQRAINAGFGSVAQLESDPDLKRLEADARMPVLKQAADRNGRPCVYAPEYRQLDFWIGDWDVTSATGGFGGRSHIELIEDQCVIFENFSTPAGYSGRSLNSYHPDKKHWEQFYVDNQGTIHHYVGHFRDGNLYYEAEGVRTAGPQSPPAKVKMTFFNQGEGQVRQLGEQSTDGGKTWATAYDLVYRRPRPHPDPKGCAGIPSDVPAVSDVRAVATGIIEADNARALDRVLDYYAADAVLLPPSEPPVVGRERIRPRYEALFSGFTPAIEGRIDEVCVAGSLAYVRGHNGGRMVAREGGRDRALDDTYLMLLRREADQRWRIGHLIWH